MTCHLDRSARVLLGVVLTSGCVGLEPIGGGSGDASTGSTSVVASSDDTLGATSTPSTTGDTTRGPVDTSDTSPATETTAASEATTASDTSDTGPAPQCPDNPAFLCSAPVDCSPGGCGTPFASFDADGCMRPQCIQSEDCEPGFTCLASQDYGGCESSGLHCEDDRTGACQCVSTPDCGGGHCLPDDEVPPLECFGLPDETSCLDASCSHFETVTEISDDCECTPGVPACVLFLGPFGGSDAPDYFWHEATGTVALFGTSWDWPPVGWRPCTDPGAPAACGCYEPFMEPECP